MIGSTWGKWDLHIHSPMTHLSNQFKSATIQNFIDQVARSDISLIGVTNYFYFKQNELETIRSTIYENGNQITVLGNVEFRIAQPNNAGEWINIHCIFSEKLTTEQINNVLSTMPITNTSPVGMTVYCSESSMKLHNVRPDQAVVDFKTLKSHLAAHLQYGVDYLIGICPNGYGGFRPTPNVGRSLTIAFEIEKQGDFIFGSTEKDREFFLDQNRFEGAKRRPVFRSSDAHSISSIGTQYSWVKARPSFEGLRQVLIEPEERIQIHDDFIERTFIKPKFKSIKANGVVFEGQPLQFKPTDLYLNPNMVAIIGGRGTGKSILLDAIRSKFKHNPSSVEYRNVDIQDFSIVLDQGQGTLLSFDGAENNYDYLHVSQGDIQRISQTPDELSNEIKQMLGIHNHIFNSITETETNNALSRYKTFINYWLQTDQAGNAINTDSYQNNLIKNYTNLIATLTSPQNKSLIEKYQLNIRNINELTSYVTTSNQLKNTLEQSIASINASIQNININQFTTTLVPEISYTISLNTINSNLYDVQKKINTLAQENQQIVSDFQKQGINQDISSLLSKVTEYQSQIDLANAKLIEIKTKTDEYHADIVKRGQMSVSYREHLKSEVTAINKAFEVLLADKSAWNPEQNALVKEILTDISIYGAIHFDETKFFNGLLNTLNRGKFRETSSQTTIARLKETFPIHTAEDFFRLISNDNVIKLSAIENAINLESFCWKGEYFNQSGRFELLDFLFTSQSIQSYLYVNAEFRYKKKTVDKLSVGQRGTFYVCLKLATDPFGSPFIFDQPEDDLDNDFIMHKLVPLFRKIKKYRQVIIVTHNANLVVNSDAEQIIVAHNDDEILSYSSGAVEDGAISDSSSIRAKICNILEGGDYAFEMRERKYGLIRSN